MPRRPPAWQRAGFDSQREYDDWRAEEAGWPDYATFRRARRDPALQRLLRYEAASKGVSERSLWRIGTEFSSGVARLGVGRMWQHVRTRDELAGDERLAASIEVLRDLGYDVRPIEAGRRTMEEADVARLLDDEYYDGLPDYDWQEGSPPP